MVFGGPPVIPNLSFGGPGCLGIGKEYSLPEPPWLSGGELLNFRGVFPDFWEGRSGFKSN